MLATCDTDLLGLTDSGWVKEVVSGGRLTMTGAIMRCILLCSEAVSRAATETQCSQSLNIKGQIIEANRARAAAGNRPAHGNTPPCSWAPPGTIPARHEGSGRSPCNQHMNSSSNHILRSARGGCAPSQLFPGLPVRSQ